MLYFNDDYTISEPNHQVGASIITPHTASNVGFIKTPVPTGSGDQDAEAVSNTALGTGTNVTFQGRISIAQQMRAVPVNGDTFRINWLQTASGYYTFQVNKDGTWTLGTRAKPSLSYTAISSGSSAALAIGHWYDFDISHNVSTGALIVNWNHQELFNGTNTTYTANGGTLGFQAVQTYIQFDHLRGNFAIDFEDYTPTTVSTATVIKDWNWVSLPSNANGSSFGGVEKIATLDNVDIVLQPRGTGAILANVPDSTGSGGNKRGPYSVDLQLDRDGMYEVASGDASVALGSKNGCAGHYAGVLSGVYNSSSLSYSVVAGGTQNNVYGLYSNICGGEGNGMATTNPGQADHCVIGGGYQNKIEPNNVSSTCYNNVIGGGKLNLVGNVSNSTIGGGSSNKNSSWYGTIPGGSYAATRGTSGQYAYASGSFSTAAGTAQYGMYIMRSVASGTTTTTLTTDGSAPGASNTIILGANTSMAFVARIVAREATTGDSKSWEIRGLIRKDATNGSVVVVGSSGGGATGLFSQGAASTWTANVGVDTTNGTFYFTFTGSTGVSCRVVATVETAEVTED